MNTNVESEADTTNEEPYRESTRTRIIQRITDLYLDGRLKLEEMCNLLRDIGEDNKAMQYETTTSDHFRAGEDGFCMSANRESEDIH